MTPDPNPSGQTEAGAPAGAPSTPQPPAPPRSMWPRRIASVVFIVFCLELGLFLMIYPWTDSWTNNYFSFFTPAIWHEIWVKGYVRGAVSGLGLLNIWIAIAEALRMYIDSGKDE